MKNEHKDERGKDHQIFSSDFSSMKPVGAYGVHKSAEEDNSISTRFYKEREEWRIRIANLSKRIKNINDLAELQVDVYSSRQELVEYFHYISSLMASKNAEVRKKRKARSEFYLTGYDYKLSPKDKEMYIAIDLEDDYIILNELENHSKYISSTLGTVDNIIYGIKHRITLEEYKRRL